MNINAGDQLWQQKNKTLIIIIINMAFIMVDLSEPILDISSFETNSCVLASFLYFFSFLFLNPEDELDYQCLA